MEIRQAQNIGRLQDFLFNPDVESNVRQGEWKVSQDRLRTSCVATCVVMAAHNEASQRGVLGHFSSISPTSEENTMLVGEQFDGQIFGEAVDYLHELGPLTETTIWLGGVALYASDDTDLRRSKLADRLHAETKIAELLEEQGETGKDAILGWNKTENDLYVQLDAKSGTVLVQAYRE